MNLEIKIGKKIGRGRYSEVYKGKYKNKTIVLKILKPVPDEKIIREAKILEELNNCENIIKLISIIKGVYPTFVFEYIKGIDHRILFPTLSNEDIKYYMFKTLKGIEFAHNKGIMHRDIKPQNIIFNHKNHSLRIIDWGLAEYYIPEKEYSTSVASLYYKSPEILMGFTKYTPLIDIWSFGCMFGGALFNKEPLFQGDNQIDMLTKISKILGSKSLIKFSKLNNLNLSIEQIRAIGNHPKRNWNSFELNNRTNSISLDLLNNCLKMNKRFTALDAINHSYFDEIRNL